MSDFSLFLPPKSDPGLLRHPKLQLAILDLTKENNMVEMVLVYNDLFDINRKSHPTCTISQCYIMDAI